ncbi:DNA cytosine methyltransferase [Candidatus Methylopumilus planktonicus]|uniref:DNA cytosine methyltransferase n=1 Tax=Candidatus Methylopumilus planktonicus TaxID=1581557 RepID=UPI0011221DD9|nr:DNA cytosine methyltransferase [Candidatus Methylopumilus planktonicus]QDD11011.1 DNA cytosine methyltransferase [Candidatus Methylopumilus planktonicus]QDD23481.1 DNA cytosine methyltransferase [Candidatus Methylopumilus planktonicus]
MKVIDIFAGCGGFSLGFQLANFNSQLAIEVDSWASETFAFNHPGVKVITEDIRKISIKDLKLPKIDGIIGGPPCQGFSLSGNRDTKDPRNSLFMEFVRFVYELKPKFFVMENVLGLLSMKTKKNIFVKDIIEEEFNRAGYNLVVKVLNSANYGVPQLRQRVFFIGIRNDLPFIPEDLIPTKTNKENSFVTLWDAISDLPQIDSGCGDDSQSYLTKANNSYQRSMRVKSRGIFNHIAMRHTNRLIERFKQISYGQSVKDVSDEHSQRKRGAADQISGKVFSQNNMRPYPNKPSPTVAASFQSNFIHPYLNRNFTAREGARIQSFPDTYIFKGKRTTMSWEKNLSQYQQIGNAVPPLMAKALGKMIVKYFNLHSL